MPTQPELQRIEYLLAKAKREGVTKEEEQELRALIKKQNPEAKTDDIGSLIAAAAIIVGFIALLGILTKK